MNLNNSQKICHKILLFVAFILFFVQTQTLLKAEPGITNNSILLGQSCVLSGPSEDLGKGMNAGIIAAFEQSNVKGGIHGRQIKLISLDDYYEPGQAIRNIDDLIYNHNVFLLIGEVGTPTSRVVVPIAEKARVPFLAPYTGAKFLRSPFKRQVINIRAGYDEETKKIVDYLVIKKKFKRIACFYQDDSFGTAGLEGVEKALASHNLSLVSSDTYERNTVAVMGGFQRIKSTRPEAVILVSSYLPCAEFIKLGKSKGMENTLFCTLSFVGSNALKNSLREAGNHTIISQVMPFPLKKTSRVIENYFAAMKEFLPGQQICYISFEGYIAGRFFIEVARDLKDNLTRENFINHIEEKKEFNIDNIKLIFGPDDHQGMDKTYLSIIKDGEIIPLAD